jgi:hypothetical protein
MFSETRYALNGDLRVAYRASRECPRDIVFVSNWFTNCEVFQNYRQYRLGRGNAIARSTHLLDHPGTGASDPVTPDAMPNLERWADSITAVLDDLGSREAVLVAIDGALALFAATLADDCVGRSGGLRRSAHRAHRGTHTRRTRRHDRDVRHWRVPACAQPGHAVERGDSGFLSPT